MSVEVRLTWLGCTCSICMDLSPAINLQGCGQSLGLHAITVFTANGHQHTATATILQAFVKMHFWYSNGMVVDH